MLKRITKPLMILVASFTLAMTVLATFPAYQAEAAKGFSAGFIIHDSNFYTSSPTMSVDDIQKFLNTQGQNCSTKNGVPCLKDFKQTTRSRSADKMCPKPYAGASNESAAQIIYKTSQACNIAPQVLLVTLQKEQSLVTSNYRGWTGYKIAMGYGCPDYAQCDSKYYGFANQVYNAAHQFQRYRLYPNSFNFAAGRTSFIQYNPNKSCGGTYVKVQNAATAGLYNYTPYQPGKGGKCATYGNKNFHSYYTSWFGDPQTPSQGQPLREANNPPANTSAPTGTEDATKNEATQVSELKLELKLSDGNAIPTDKGLAGESKLKLHAEGFDADAAPIIKIDDAEQTTEAKANSEGKLDTEITVPKEGGKHTIAVAQKGSDGKPAANKKEATAEIQVLYSEGKILSVKYGDKEIGSGAQVTAGEKLSFTAVGLKEGDAPKVVYRNVNNLNETKTVEAGKVDGFGALKFDVTVPETAGKYVLVVPGVDQHFEFEVVAKAAESRQVRREVEVSTMTDANGKVINQGDSVEAGIELTVELANLEPEEQPTIELHSDPVVVPTGKADANGKLSVKFKAPCEQGEHTLKYKKQGTMKDLFKFKVTGSCEVPQTTVQQASISSPTSQLAKTGNATAPMLAVTIMLIGTGLAVSSYARSRQPISVN